MDDELAAAIAVAPVELLVEIVKMAQKQGRKGTQGGWKDFLNVFDKQMGSCLSDPARRSRQTLASFLKTFNEKEDLKFMYNILRVNLNREILRQVMEQLRDNELPEQRLVWMTLEHPAYLSTFSFPSYEEDWVVTKLSKKSKLMRSGAMLAVDCEMVLCEDGTDALVRVCVVDKNLQVKLDEKVNPYKPIADYRTDITGITAADLDGVTCSLADVQKSMKKLLRKGTILVGHSLFNDLQALKLDHSIVIDTSLIFKTSNGRTPSLNNLYKALIGSALREKGAPHNCLDDARAAMKVVLSKIERGVDADILLIEEEKDVEESQMAKLFIHKIPLNVPSGELHGVFPVNFTIELVPPKKAQGGQYSVLAVFENQQEADKAFEELVGRPEKDTKGLPQKRIMFQLSTGEFAKLYVRKMPCKVSLKRKVLEDDTVDDTKRLKMDECADRLKEIDRLKQEIREKELNKCVEHQKEIEGLKQELNAKNFQILTQDKIIIDLKKKLEQMKKRR